MRTKRARSYLSELDIILRYGKIINGKKNINKSATKTKIATTPKAIKGVTKGQKDKNEITKTPTPRKQSGSEFTSLKK